MHQTLTLAEEERLTLLMEECAEVIQVASKILRFGFDDVHPHRENPLPNRIELEIELGDVLCVARMMYKAHDLSPIRVESAVGRKQVKIRPYLRYQPEVDIDLYRNHE